MVALAELDLQLDAREVRRGRMEDDPVTAWIERRRKARDAPVVVSGSLRYALRAAEELDLHPARGCSLAGVEDVRRERGGHARTLRLEAATQPRERLDALRVLELAQGRQPGRRGQRGPLDEEAGQCCDGRVDVLGPRAAGDRVIVEELPRLRPALHRDAREEGEQVAPWRAETDVRPVDEDAPLRREQDVVRAHVGVEQRSARRRVFPLRLEARKRLQPPGCPGVETDRKSTRLNS